MSSSSQSQSQSQSDDTEITLGTGKLLVIFFVLVVSWSFFFAMGYLLGRANGAGERTSIVSAAPTGGSSSGKPSAGDKNSDTPVPTTTATPAPTPIPTPAPASSPAPTPDNRVAIGGPYIVQVAAVSKLEDAQSLIAALQKKQYPAFVENVPGDSLFDFQVGPFSDPKDAETMRARLAGDGYNAIVKK